MSLASCACLPLQETAMQHPLQIRRQQPLQLALVQVASRDAADDLRAVVAQGRHLGQSQRLGHTDRVVVPKPGHPVIGDAVRRHVGPLGLARNWRQYVAPEAGYSHRNALFRSDRRRFARARHGESGVVQLLRARRPMHPPFGGTIYAQCHSGDPPVARSAHRRMTRIGPKPLDSEPGESSPGLRPTGGVTTCMHRCL